MKTIVVLTDFSLRADHAAFYALKLAQKVKADLLLCNVYDITEDSEELDMAMWPAGNYETFEENSRNDLADLTARLNKQLDLKTTDAEFRPDVKCCSKPGPLADAVIELTARNNVQMAVISMHSGNVLSTFLLGDHANEIIENAKCPVLIVPYQVPFTSYKKISFTTDLIHNSTDILHSLSDFSKYFDSEILITHVTAERAACMEERDIINGFFEAQAVEEKYPKMYYRAIKNKSVAAGLNLLAEQSDIDLLVLVHHNRNLFQKLFDGSVTHKLADHLSKPMLVFPGAKLHEPLPVF